MKLYDVSCIRRSSIGRWFTVSQDLSEDSIRTYLEQDEANAVIFHKSDRKSCLVVFRSSDGASYRLSERK